MQYLFQLTKQLLINGIALVFLFSLNINLSFAQSATVKQNITKLFDAFEKDPQLQNAMVGFVVVDEKTGKTIFEKNANVGLVPASCQKVITSAAAYSLLGNNFTFETKLKWATYNNKNLLMLEGGFDPTLGSWRYKSKPLNSFFEGVAKSVDSLNIPTIDELYFSQDVAEGMASIPNSWSWDDIGNYYGASARQLSYHENQYDIFFKTGSVIGEKTKITGTSPTVPYTFFNEVKTASENSGDESIVYATPNSNKVFIDGTLPANKSKFTVGATMVNAPLLLADTVAQYLQNKLAIGKIKTVGITENDFNNNIDWKTVLKYQSVSLDSVSCWFLKKSVNLYGEAFLRALAINSAKKPSIINGVEVLKDFWLSKKITNNELNIYDGCGLSPQNRITPNAFIKVMQYAKSQSWFNNFFDGFPVYNDMRMKSGTIADTKGFVGYHSSLKNEGYFFCILVNNYNGSTSEVVKKMYKVLDALK